MIVDMIASACRISSAYIHTSLLHLVSLILDIFIQRYIHTNVCCVLPVQMFSVNKSGQLRRPCKCYNLDILLQSIYPVNSVYFYRLLREVASLKCESSFAREPDACRIRLQKRQKIEGSLPAVATPYDSASYFLDESRGSVWDKAEKWSNISRDSEKRS